MESVTKHDTSSLKLQGRRSPLHAVQPVPEAAWKPAPAENTQSAAVMAHRRADCQNVCKHACSFIHMKH